MSDIPEHILAQARRFAARGMPLEQIAFFTRIDADILEAELQKEAPPAVEEESEPADVYEPEQRPANE